MIEYVIRTENRGVELLRVYQDYDLAQVMLAIDDKTTKVPIAELEIILENIKGKQNERFL